MDATIALCAMHEERSISVGKRQLPVPVVLVAGSLGSGKTTLLNHILHNKLNLRVTCLVNDLASLNLDADVLVRRDAAERTVRLSNGCACHSLAGDFETEMWQVLQETDGSDRVDYIVVETSGVVEPLSLVHSLQRRFGRMTRARLDGVVVVVDADELAHQLDLAEAAGGLCRAGDGADDGGDPAEWAAAAATTEADAERARACLIDAAGASLWRQLQCADTIVLNKMDLLEGAEGAEGAEGVEGVEGAAGVEGAGGAQSAEEQEADGHDRGGEGGGGLPRHESAPSASDGRCAPASERARRLECLVQRAAPWAAVFCATTARLPLRLLRHVDDRTRVAGGGAAEHEARLLPTSGGS